MMNNHTNLLFNLPGTGAAAVPTTVSIPTLFDGASASADRELVLSMTFEQMKMLAGKLVVVLEGLTKSAQDYVTAQKLSDLLNKLRQFVPSPDAIMRVTAIQVLQGTINLTIKTIGELIPTFWTGLAKAVSAGANLLDLLNSYIVASITKVQDDFPISTFYQNANQLVAKATTTIPLLDNCPLSFKVVVAGLSLAGIGVAATVGLVRKLKRSADHANLAEFTRKEQRLQSDLAEESLGTEPGASEHTTPPLDADVQATGTPEPTPGNTGGNGQELVSSNPNARDEELLMPHCPEHDVPLSREQLLQRDSVALLASSNEATVPTTLQPAPPTPEEEEAARSILDIKRQANEISDELQRFRELLKAERGNRHCSSRNNHGGSSKVIQADTKRYPRGGAEGRKPLINKSNTKRRITASSESEVDSDESFCECLD